MASMAQIARETEYATNLQRARRKPNPEQVSTPEQTETPLKPISLVEAFFVISLFLIFFDLPQALFAATFIGITLNILWVPLGYFAAYLWLKLKGRSLFGGKSGNKLLYIFGATSGAELLSGGLLPGLSGFILGVIITGQIEQSLAKIAPASEKLTGSVHKLGNIAKH